MATIRPTREADLRELGDLLDGIFRRPRGVMDQSMLTDFPLVFAPSNWRNCRVVEEDGRIVAHAGLWRRELLIDGERLVVGVLVSVATHPDFRHRGYAAQAVQALQDLMHEESYDLGLLWTAVPDFYHKLGWELAQPRGALVLLTPERLAAEAAAGYPISRFDLHLHAEEVYTLHEREPIRFARSPEESRSLHSLPKIETWVASRGGRQAAYLVHSLGCSKRGLIEYGGELEGITELARQIIQRQPSGSEIPLLAYHVRPDLIDWAQRLGLTSKPLESSKGLGREMILPVRQPIPPSARTQLFTWGLDHA